MPIHRYLRRAAFTPTVLLWLLLAACGGNGTQPPSGEGAALSIAAPLSGQTLSGTVPLAASGIGGKAVGLRFRLGGVEVAAAADGIAILDTRALTDGEHTLEALATVAGRPAQVSIPVVVANQLPSSATVGAAGGGLRSAAGSYATLLPGALAAPVQVALIDLGKEEILATFGVDYEALGVTFLGALTVGSEVEAFDLPLQVDLAGQAQAVQPGHQVLMFTLAPDTDGDGVGELMAAADAQATPDGSVITRPIPRSEVYGFGAAGQGSFLRATVSARPGEIVALAGRGFLAGGAFSNVARLGDGVEVLVRSTVVEDAPFNALQRVEFAVPAVGAGSRSVRLANLSTGFESQATALTVGALGTASAAAWQGFTAQLRVAVARLAAGRPALADLAEPWLAELEGSTAATAAAMAHNSGLVSSGARARLEAIAAGAYDAEQRSLVAHHALLLDALAASVPELAVAAELARLLQTMVPVGAAPASSALWPQQDDITIGDPCAAVGAAGPGATGMGGGPPPGGSGCGAAGGPGGNGGGSALAPQQAGGFGPVEGAIVRVLRRGSGAKLSPFTSLTDETGYYRIPFIPEGEPFTVHAIDPRSGATATADGVGPAYGEGVVLPLVFTAVGTEAGAPTASFTIEALPSGELEGSWNYAFDATASSDPDGEIVEYIWDFGGVVVANGNDYYATIHKGYGRNGTYDVGLTVIDDDGKVAVSRREFVIDDLPYDYWGVPPERVSVGADGTLPDGEPDWFSVMSADGRYVAFTTTAGNLDPDDVNGRNDVYLKDMESSALELVSGGAAGLEAWSDVAMSADARYVAYTEEESQQFGTGPNRILIQDRQEGTVEVVTNPDGYRSNAVVALDDGGRLLAFRASSLNVAERGNYVLNLDTDQLTRVGRTLDGAGYASISLVDLSGDGRYVVFTSADATLVEGDTNGVADVFVTDLTTGDTTRVSVASDGTEANGRSGGWGNVIRADGREVVFWSEATNLLAGDANGDAEDVFVKDLGTGEVELVSANALGHQADGTALAGVISADGRYVAFGAYASNLVPIEDSRDDGWGSHTPGFSYVKDRVTGRVVLVTMGRDGAMPNEWDQIEPVLSADGRYVGFYSWASNLVPGDVPDTLDLFRVANPLWQP